MHFFRLFKALFILSSILPIGAPSVIEAAQNPEQLNIVTGLFDINFDTGRDAFECPDEYALIKSVLFDKTLSPCPAVWVAVHRPDLFVRILIRLIDSPGNNGENFLDFINHWEHNNDCCFIKLVLCNAILNGNIEFIESILSILSETELPTDIIIWHIVMGVDRFGRNILHFANVGKLDSTGFTRLLELLEHCLNKKCKNHTHQEVLAWLIRGVDHVHFTPIHIATRMEKVNNIFNMIRRCSELNFDGGLPFSLEIELKKLGFTFDATYGQYTWTINNLRYTFTK